MKEKLIYFLKVTRLFKPLESMIASQKKRAMLKDFSTEMGDQKKLTSYDKLEFEIRYLVHMIEKNACVGNTVYFRRVSVAMSLVEALRKLEKMGIHENSNITTECISALELFIENAVEPSITAKLRPFLPKEKNKTSTIRINPVRQLDCSITKSYPSFAETRHSQRIMSDEIISEDEIREIVKVALLCPSACNRQPCKVYYTLIPSVRKELQALCCDSLVSKRVFNYFVITVQKDMFSVGEMHQSWINGGIFLDSMVNAIHARGIGSCLFQTPTTNRRYAKIKNLLHIPEREDIISLIGYGRYTSESKYVSKHRRNPDEILVKV